MRPAIPAAYLYEKVTVPKQDDGHQCGVWTCIHAMCIVQGNRLQDLRTAAQRRQYAHQARLYLAGVMRTNSLSLVPTAAVDMASMARGPRRQRTAEWMNADVVEISDSDSE